MGEPMDVGSGQTGVLSRSERRFSKHVLRRVDWRGWIALAWALFWGVSYCGMVVQARGDRIRAWFSPPRRPILDDRKLIQDLAVFGPGSVGQPVRDRVDLESLIG